MLILVEPIEDRYTSQVFEPVYDDIMNINW